MLKPRGYQLQVVKELQIGKANLLTNFTGSGKSFVFKLIIDELFKDDYVLIISNLKKVIEQLTKYFEDRYLLITGETDKKTVNKKANDKLVHLSTYQSFHKLENFDIKNYKLIIFDEIHYYHNNPTFKTLFKLNTTRLGSTATPLNNKNKLLKGWDNWIQTIDLKTAIDRNYAAPFTIIVKNNFYQTYSENLKVNSSGEYDVNTINQLITKEHLLEAIEKEVYKYLPNLATNLATNNTNNKILIFLPFIHLVDELYDKLNLKFKYKVHSKMSENEQKQQLEEFKKIDKGVMIAVRSVATGVDIPDANILILGIFTRINTNLLQIVGRVLRYKKDKTAQIIDMTGNFLQPHILSPYTNFKELKEKGLKRFLDCEENCKENFVLNTIEYETCLDYCQSNPNNFVFKRCGAKPSNPFAKNIDVGNGCNELSLASKWKYWTESDDTKIIKYAQCPICSNVQSYELEPLNIINDMYLVREHPTNYMYIFFTNTNNLIYIFKKIENKYETKFVTDINNEIKTKMTVFINQKNIFSNAVYLPEMNDWIKYWRPGYNILYTLIYSLTRRFAQNVGYKPGIAYYLKPLISKNLDKKILGYLLEHRDSNDTTDFKYYRYELLGDINNFS